MKVSWKFFFLKSYWITNLEFDADIVHFDDIQHVPEDIVFLYIKAKMQSIRIKAISIVKLTVISVDSKVHTTRFSALFQTWTNPFMSAVATYAESGLKLAETTDSVWPNREKKYK